MEMELDNREIYRRALDEIFHEFTFSKNQNLTAGNINVPLPPELFKYKIEEITKSSYDPVYFAENYYHIISPAKGKHIIDMYEKQAELLNTMVEEDRVVTLASRQCGKTTSYCIFCCHTVCFNNDKNIVILANKLSTRG